MSSSILPAEAYLANSVTIRGYCQLFEKTALDFRDTKRLALQYTTIFVPSLMAASALGHQIENADWGTSGVGGRAPLYAGGQTAMTDDDAEEGSGDVLASELDPIGHLMFQFKDRDELTGGFKPWLQMLALMPSRCVRANSGFLATAFDVLVRVHVLAQETLRQKGAYSSGVTPHQLGRKLTKAQARDQKTRS